MSSRPELSPLARRLMQGKASEFTPPRLHPAALPVDAPARKRGKLWELSDKHHCPVIGTCLAMADLVRLARRFSFSSPINDEYGLHVEAVGYSRERNAVSEAIQRLLDTKFAVTVKQFALLKSEADLRGQWKSCLARGEVAGPLWAAYTHKAGSAETRQMIYGDIHMLSHQVGAGQAADARRLLHLEEENKLLQRNGKQEIHALQAQLRQLQASHAALEQGLGEHTALRKQHDAVAHRLAQFESGQVMVDLGRKLMELSTANDRLLAAAQRAWELDHTLKAAHEEMERICRERDAALAEKQAMARFVAALASTEASCPDSATDQCAVCEHALAARCILYVGGRTSMIAQYRQLADRLGITLIHHDGGLEESLSRLPEMIHGADAVVCPTDQISHAAYYQVKNHCKRVGKPCLFYKGSGVSSFAAAMTQVSRQEFSLGQGEKIPAPT